jgi:hypothetical protein
VSLRLGKILALYDRAAVRLGVTADVSLASPVLTQCRTLLRYSAWLFSSLDPDARRTEYAASSGLRKWVRQRFADDQMPIIWAEASGLAFELGETRWLDRLPAILNPTLDDDAMNVELRRLANAQHNLWLEIIWKSPDHRQATSSQDRNTKIIYSNEIEATWQPTADKIAETMRNSRARLAPGEDIVLPPGVSIPYPEFEPCQ